MYNPPAGYICGCYYLLPPLHHWLPPTKQYIAQISTKVHTTILAATSRTILTQTFENPSEQKAIKELSYSFPLYDGVSVVGFTCRIGDRVIKGEVKEKEKARAVYEEAKNRGEVAGLLEQLPEASDVFVTKLGNVPPASSITVEIIYLGELKHDAEVDGVRFTIPSYIAPRYGSYPTALTHESVASKPKCRTSKGIQQGFEITVDASLTDGAYIREMRSPSHPIAVSLGTISTAKEKDPTPNKASATLSLNTAELEKDFVLQIVAKETAIPKAVLETHPTIPGQRALMATLVPKFDIPAERPEIVFVCDRSGSMMGNKIVALRNALKVFLKSLPLGTKFNICSFGSSYSFLWPKSQSYSQTSLDQAMKHLETFDANFGGTEMYQPMEETIKRRYSDMNLEIFLVTDGEIWDQQKLFDLLNKEIGQKKAPIRVFTLGVGDAFSSSLIEGVARAGNGFSQAVGENEKLDGKVVRMLKAALTPHIEDYTLEVKYADGETEKAIESVSVSIEKSSSTKAAISFGKNSPSLGSRIAKKTISLFDTSADAEKPNRSPSPGEDDAGQSRYAHLPAIEPPKLLQAPHKIPPLFPFSRTSVYLLISPLADQSQPVSVFLRATSKYGPLELEIPVQILDQPGETIHQLAAKKAVHELEEGRGWLASAKDAASGSSLKEKHEGRFSEFVEREAVRLGVQFQVGGKFCSFVAVENKEKDKHADKMDEDWEYLDDEIDKLNLSDEGALRYDTKSRRTGRRVSTHSSLTNIRDRDSDASASEIYRRTKSIGGSRGRSKGGLRFFSASAPRKRTAAAPSAAVPPPPAPRSAGFIGGMQKKSASSGMLSNVASFRNSASRPAMQQAQLAPMMSMALPHQALSAASVPGGAAEGAGYGAPPPSTAFGSAVGYGTSPLSMSSAAQSQMDTAYAMPVDSEEDEDEDMAYDLFAAPASAPTGASKERKRRSSSPKLEKSSAPSAAASDPLLVLTDLQTFEGYWDLTEKLCAAVGVTMAQVARAIMDEGFDKKIAATALAVEFLTTKLADQKESWELIVDKAKDWLEGQGHGKSSGVWALAKASL